MPRTDQSLVMVQVIQGRVCADMAILFCCLATAVSSECDVARTPNNNATTDMSSTTSSSILQTGSRTPAVRVTEQLLTNANGKDHQYYSHPRPSVSSSSGSRLDPDISKSPASIPMDMVLSLLTLTAAAARWTPS